jgi:hypothetical protein
VKSADPDVESQKDAVFIAHVKQDVLKLGAKSPLEIARGELAKKLTALRKEQLMVGVIESDSKETLVRFKRSKRPFGAHIEDRLLAISERGLQTAHCGPLRFLPGDSFFNKWEIPLIQSNLMPQMEDTVYDKLFESEMQTDRLAGDAGQDDGYDASMECQTKSHVIPFPHEYHPLLTKEEIHVFKAEIIFDLAVGSGFRLMAVMEMNLTGVGCCKTAAHKEWVHNNLVKWVKEKRLVNLTPVPKPAELVEYEKKNLAGNRQTQIQIHQPTGSTSSTQQPSTPAPTAVTASPTTTGSAKPSPTPSATGEGTHQTGSAGRSLLAAFGGVQM